MPSKTPSPASHPPLGTLVDGDSLELVEVLGIGGYGVVYRAVDTRSSFPKSYAVKCLVDPLPQPNGRQRHIHIREITLHQLASAHPNVVTLHRVIEDYNYTYIVMDYANDGDLFSQILHSCRYLGDDHLIKQVFLQLLDAVEYCHSLGIYHRDLKPENVLCFDGGLRVAITDFGLATTDKVSEEFRTGSVYHMSPECQGGAFAPTGSYSPMFNDIWSLAIILLNLATGRNPWKSASASDPTFQAYLQEPMSFLPTVLPISPELNSILVRMLEVDWRDRMTLPELRRAIQDVDNFYSDGVIFEGSMARCPWEAGMDIDSDSSTKGKSPQADSRDELKSRWSKDSASESDIVFASQSTTEDSSYERWTAYSSCAATWGFESPMSSTDSQRMLENLRMWDPPQTPPSTRSPLSPSFGSTSSLPVTPNSADASFGDRVNITPQKPLTLDTNCGRLRQNGSAASSSGSSSLMMQTAIEYIPYSSSFFLASSGSPSKASLEMLSTVDFGDDEENKEMDTVSTWEYAATDMSYPSIYSRTKSSLACQDIVCDIKSPTVLCSDIINWPDFHLQTTFVSPPQLLQPVSVCSDNPPVSKMTPRNPSKKLYEAKSRGASLFKFFPRSPRSSSSFSRGSTFTRSRTPSPPLKQPWTLAPSRPRTPLSTQDGNCRRTGRSIPKRHWFSRGKFFAASAS